MRTGWCFEAAHIPGVINVLADGFSRWPRQTINLRISSFLLPFSLGRGTFGEEWCDHLFASLAGLLSTVGVAPSTNVTYEFGRRVWTQWRLLVVHRSLHLVMELGEEAVARKIAKYMAHLDFLVAIQYRRSKGNWEQCTIFIAECG